LVLSVLPKLYIDLHLALYIVSLALPALAQPKTQPAKRNASLEGRLLHPSFLWLWPFLFFPWDARTRDSSTISPTYIILLSSPARQALPLSPSAEPHTAIIYVPTSLLDCFPATTHAYRCYTYRTSKAGGQHGKTPSVPWQEEKSSIASCLCSHG